LLNGQRKGANQAPFLMLRLRRLCCVATELSGATGVRLYFRRLGCGGDRTIGCDGENPPSLSSGYALRLPTVGAPPPLTRGNLSRMRRFFQYFAYHAGLPRRSRCSLLAMTASNCCCFYYRLQVKGGIYDRLPSLRGASSASDVAIQRHYSSYAMHSPRPPPAKHVQCPPEPNGRASAT
jgi:hypothetical protein